MAKRFGIVLVSAAALIAVADTASFTTDTSPLEPSASEMIAAITPTPGGIGINPVSADLGSPHDYVLTDLGPNNPVITWDGHVYHYIEGHTSYLSVETITTTVNSQTSTMTSTVKVSVQTAGSDDADPGALGITFSEDVADALRKTANAAIEVCELNKRSIVKRYGSTTCVIDAAVGASDDGPLNGAATDEFWESLGVEVAQDAPQYLADALAVLKSQARKTKALAILSAIFVGYVVKDTPIAAVNVPSDGVGAPDKKVTCDPTRPVGPESPLCQDPDCQGDDHQICTTGPEKDCPCLIFGWQAPLQYYNRSWWDEQQNDISSVLANPALLSSATPSCSLNSAVTGFDGKPAETPASWCVCRDDETKRLYATIDTPSSPCAYTSLPTDTISPSKTLVSASVTTCRMETNTITGIYSTPSVNTYCTCNDNSIYGIATLTTSGSTTVRCETPTSTTPSATPTPTCDYPKEFTMEQEAIVPAAERFCADNDHGYLRELSGGSYGNVLSAFNTTGASKGGTLYLYAFLDIDCEVPVFINKDDCIAAYQSIFDRCDVGAAMRQGGAASINCQWYNITAEDECVGTNDVLDPEKCPVGHPVGYQDWPMGFIPS